MTDSVVATPRVTVVVALVLVLISGYSVEAAEEFVARTVLPGLHVSTAWLKQNYTNHDLVVVDARSEEQYARLHIDRAVSLDQALTFSSEANDFKVRSISFIRTLFSKTGIDHDTAVVIYDGGGYVEASRLFWVLELFGQRRVAILAGGFAQWRGKGLPVSAQTETPVTKTFIPTIVPERLATKLETRLAVDHPNMAVIDSRAAAEYAGERDKVGVPGHIPRAVNVDWHLNLRATASGYNLADQEALAALYAPFRGKRVIAYCNYGHESTLTYFVLRLLGFDVAVYDGSWYEWVRDENLPIVD